MGKSGTRDNRGTIGAHVPPNAQTVTPTYATHGHRIHEDADFNKFNKLLNQRSFDDVIWMIENGLIDKRQASEAISLYLNKKDNEAIKLMFICGGISFALIFTLRWLFS